MNSRERLQLALNHKEADRVPFDLGATVLTSIHHQSYRALRKYLGLPDVEPRIVDIFQQIVSVDDDVRERLKVDVRDVEGIDPLSLIGHEKVMVTVDAVKKLEEMLG